MFETVLNFCAYIALAIIVGFILTVMFGGGDF